jgi:hypothetical protein
MFSSCKRIAIALGLAASLGACADDPSDVAPATSFALRVIHASPDAPAVDVLIDGAQFTTGLGYKEATSLRNRPDSGTASVEVKANLPGGTATVIGPVDVTFEADTSYQIIAVGKVADATLAPLVIDNPRSTVGNGAVRARVVHGAPDAPPVDVYVTAPADVLADVTPLGSFAFGEDLGPVEVPAGDYRIRVTLPNDPDTVVFDSGTVTLPSSDLMIVAVANTNAGAGEPGQSPISLLVADNGLGNFEILDVGAPVEFRIVHHSPDAPPVDVIIDDAFATPLLESVPFPTFSDFFAVPGGAYNVKVTGENNPGAIVIDADLDLVAGKRYSVYAVGYLASIEPYVLEEDFRSIATEAKVRIAHLAPGAGLVDIYVTAPGAGIADADPAFTGIDFKNETGYVGLMGGSYDVTVTTAGTKTVAIGPSQIDVVDGRVYTAVARDAAGGGGPFALTVIDELN